MAHNAQYHFHILLARSAEELLALVGDRLAMRIPRHLRPAVLNYLSYMVFFCPYTCLIDCLSPRPHFAGIRQDTRSRLARLLAPSSLVLSLACMRMCGCKGSPDQREYRLEINVNLRCTALRCTTLLRESLPVRSVSCHAAN